MGEFGIWREERGEFGGKIWRKWSQLVPSPIDRSLRTPHGHGDDDDDDGGLAAAAPPTSMNRRRAAAHANAMHRLYPLTLTPLHQ